jgi:hypothetical protein
MSSTIPCSIKSILVIESFEHLNSYLWHNRLSIVPPHVPKRHLCSFVLADPQLWEIDVLDLVDRDYAPSALYIKPIVLLLYHSYLDHGQSFW